MFESVKISLRICKSMAMACIADTNPLVQLFGHWTFTCILIKKAKSTYNIKTVLIGQAKDQARIGIDDNILTLLRLACEQQMFREH